MNSGHMCFTKVRKSLQILLCFCFLFNWTKYRFNWRLVSGGRFSTCNFFIIFFISSISDSYGTKTFFNPYNRLNQGIKPKVVGPLLKYSGFNQGLIDFFRIGSGTSINPQKNSRCSCILQKNSRCSCVPACDIFITCVCIYATYQIVRLRHYVPIISHDNTWHTIPSMREVWRVSATTYGCSLV